MKQMPLTTESLNPKSDSFVIASLLPLLSLRALKGRGNLIGRRENEIASVSNETSQ